MRFVLSLMIGLGLAFPVLAQEPPSEDAEPLAAAGRLRLTLDAGDHTGTINTVLFTPDGEQLITAGVDHTIRVWDRRTGELLRVLRPPGLSDGLLRPVLSPDGKQLAVNAYHGVDDKTFKAVIYLMALADGHIERVLEGHAAVGRGIRALAFSPDGKRLASGAGDKTLRIWNLTGNEPAQVIQTTFPVMALAFSPDGTRLVEAQQNHTVVIRDLAGGKVVNLGKLYPPLKLNPVAWSPDGKTIATASVDGVWLWEPSGTLRYHLPEKIRSLSVAFSKDSRRLLVVTNLTEKQPGPHTAWIINVQSRRKVLNFTPQGFVPAPRAILGIYSPDGALAVTVGSSAGGNELFLWKTTNGAVVRQTMSRSWLAGPTLQAGWSADGKSVSWIKHQTGQTGDGSPATFDLDEMQVGTSPLAAPQVREAVQKQGPFTLEVFKIKGPKLLKDGQPFAVKVPGKAVRNPGFAHALVGKDQVAFACMRKIHLMDLNTRTQVREFLLRGYVRSLAPSPDGRLLLALADDQILRILSPAQDTEVLSLYVRGQDWIAWTPQGYYAATPGGERLMGWTVDNGIGKETSYYPAERFRKVLYRPDVIKLVLKLGSVEQALKTADAAFGKKSEKVDLEQILPPRCTLDVLARDQGKVTVRVQAEAQAKSQPILGLRLFVDGRPFIPGGQRGLKEVNTRQTSADFPKGKDKVDLTWTFDLPGEKAAGAYQVAILATSRAAAAPSNTVAVSFVNAAKVSNLYVLTAGINKYNDKSLTLNFAVNDATQLAAAFAAHARKGLFAEVHPQVLTDDKATRKAVLDHIQEVRKNVKANDLFVVYFAGHGVKEKDQFYLLTVEAKVNALAATALSGVDLREALGKFPCQVLLMLDACHSAGFGEKGTLRAKKLSPATDDATRVMREDEVGVAVLCAAMGRETAQEKDGNGLFTRAVLDALGRAEGVTFNRVNHLLYTHHLYTFVFEQVSQQSGERQHPFISLPWVVQPFPVAKFVAK